jgi:hypothetical protein
MTTNRLKRSENSEIVVVPKDPKERERFWIDRGNAYLSGEAPATEGKVKGTSIKEPRPDLHWVCRNGHYSIERRVG